MSQNNNEDDANGVALAGAFGLSLALMLFAVGLFAVVIFTFIAFAALEKPVHLGKVVIRPDHAGLFLLWCAGGAVIAPVFVIFFLVLFQVPEPIPGQAWIYIVLAGYTLFGGGAMIHVLGEGQNSPPPPPAHRVIEHVPSPTPTAPPTPEPFKYADWKDEAPRPAEETPPCSPTCRELFLSRSPHPERYEIKHPAIKFDFGRFTPIACLSCPLINTELRSRYR